MPVSQGSAGGLPGLNLKAWAQVSAAGVLLRGVGVAAAGRSDAGSYTLTLSAAASSRAVCKFTMTPGNAIPTGSASGGMVSVATYSLAAPGSSVDCGFFVEVYD